MLSLNEMANAIRFLSIDAVERAASGHPGMPLGMATIATVLWRDFLKYNPKNPAWFNRDRFVLSNGHGSMLLYALLHMTGYAVSLEDLKQFRQLHSKTPGHPEYHATPGVETSTGPLGQGLANAVGMALAEQHLAKQFNRDGLTLVDHKTYVFVGDGCLMEGISHEACSLAGTLKLAKLIVFYDSNHISIDGPIDAWFTDNTEQRFQSYGWQVIGPIEGNDAAAIQTAIIEANADHTRPSLIICNTVIGYGSSLAGSAACHGSPLGALEIEAVRKFFQWTYPPFDIPESFYLAWDHGVLGNADEQSWLDVCTEYQRQFPVVYFEFLRRINGDLPDDWFDSSQRYIQTTLSEQRSMATRQSSQVCLNVYAPQLPELFGGSADLTGSNNTNWQGTIPVSATQYDGNYLHYGVREFGMAAIMNGLAVHGGMIPYGGTFLVFSDYARNAIRLSALMRIRVIYIFTHDSVALGEDGPTHQPIEHAAMLRMTPHLLAPCRHNRNCCGLETCYREI